VANGASFNGFVIPALSTRRTSTSIELGEKQSFLVSGLLDNRDTESFSKIPGVSSIPVLGQLFRSKNVTKGLTELVLVVTPEITTPLGADEAKPMIDFPNEFLVPITPVPPQPVKQSKHTTKAAKGDLAN
jgi:pilus assembly protein CpaC